uniref:Death domain-containing protein n=1 Tax=Crocodylus porosus TaxID=8502 RepID=A0A7M4G093_CROPO
SRLLYRPTLTGVVSPLQSKLLSQLMNSTRSRGTWDNHRNQKMDKLLVPQEQAGQPDPMGLTAEATLRRSFYYFAEEVPCKDWKRFGRRLHLTENEIMMAEKIGGDTLEQYVQILATWVNKEGTGSSVNTLLETLDRIHLRGVAQSVCNKLIQDGLYKYEDTRNATLCARGR